jgi:hypothetical protein
MRPGAGYLPTLALGRPRGPPTNAQHVRALRQTPRQVYRIYPEEEFLRAEDFSAQGGCDGATIRDRESGACGRLAGVAALTVAVAVVVGVVAMNEVRSRASSDRRTAGRRIAFGEPVDRRAVPGKIRSHGRTPRAGARTRRIVKRPATVERVPALAQAYTASQPQPQPVAAVAIVAAKAVTTARAPANGARSEFGFER